MNNSNGFENINEIEWINEIPRVDSVQNIYVPMGAHELLSTFLTSPRRGDVLWAGCPEAPEPRE